jgi:hypothetical protein
MILSTAAMALGALQWNAQPLDYSVFAPAGAHLWAGSWDQVYSDPVVQAGPLQLGFMGALHPLAALHGGFDYALLNVLGPVALVLGLMSTMARLRTFVGLARSPRVELAVAALALAWGWATDASTLGHPAQVLIPAAWLFAGMACFRNRPVLAGGLLAAATGFETWALLGLPLLLILPLGRGTVRAGTTFLLGSLALWSPFVLAGGFHMGQMTWAIEPYTPVGHLLGAGSFTSLDRAVQLACSLVAGIVVAVTTRGSRHSTWLVPLSAVLIRLALDPLQFGYYWLAPMALTFVAVGTVDLARRRLLVLTLSLAYLQAAAFSSFPRTLTLVASAPLLLLCAATARTSAQAERRPGVRSPLLVSPT